MKPEKISLIVLDYNDHLQWVEDSHMTLQNKKILSISHVICFPHSKLARGDRMMLILKLSTGGGQMSYI